MSVVIYYSSGHGHIRQRRFKAFPIQEDERLLTVLRYVERNPVRALDTHFGESGYIRRDAERPGRHSHAERGNEFSLQD
jgi:hypothetical protein